MRASSSAVRPNICATEPIESPGRTVYGIVVRGRGGGLGAASAVVDGEVAAAGAQGAAARGAAGIGASGERTIDEGGLPEGGTSVSERSLVCARHGTAAAIANATARDSIDTLALNTRGVT